MIKSFVGYVLRFIPRPFLQIISKPIFKVISIFYFGNKVKCPICKSSFSKFFPYGRMSRENALCTNCLSLERHRLIYLFLKRKTTLFKNKIDLLHIAPEECLIKKLKKNKNINYTSADLESPLADVKMDIHKMPFVNNSFDFVLCNHVLEHVENDLKALEEIKRVLRKGGKGIVQVPFYYPIPEETKEDKKIISKREREITYGQSDHVRKYGKDYKKRLESSGFKVTVSLPSEFLTKSEIELYSISESEEIYLINN